MADANTKPFQSRGDVVANPEYAVQYGAVHAEAQRTGQCPFCSGSFPDQLVVIGSSGGWYAAPSQYPTKDRSGSSPEHHILLVPFEHKTGELDEQDALDIFRLARAVCRKLGIDGGGVAYRFGNPARSGATIVHRHVHLIVPRRLSPGEELAKKAVDFAVG